MALLGEGHQLVRREYPTAIGPVDLLVRVPATTGSEKAAVETAVPAHRHVAVEIKRRAGIDAVEQLTRYLELLNRDPHIAPVHGVLAAQAIAPQARTLATDRGIDCLLLDYDAMRGVDDVEARLF